LLLLSRDFSGGAPCPLKKVLPLPELGSNDKVIESTYKLTLSQQLDSTFNLSPAPEFIF